MTLAELNRKVFKTLMDNLGYVEAKRFESGDGDYTVDRHEWLDDPSLDDIWSDIQKR